MIKQARAIAIDRAGNVVYVNEEYLPALGLKLVGGLVDRFYSGVSRCTTSGFLRIKLGEALEKRGVAPHIFESAEEAQSDWRIVEGLPGV